MLVESEGKGNKFCTVKKVRSQGPKGADITYLWLI